MTSILNNEIKFNVLCHIMAKNNLSLACNYITDIFNDSISHKDRCNKTIKASLLIVRGFLLCIPFINRITQFALRILSPELTTESFSDFGEEELEIRYSAEVLLSYCLQGSQNPDQSSKEELDNLMKIFALFEDLEEFQEALQDPNGFFTELNQEDKQQMLQLYSIFLENPEEFQGILQDSLQNLSQEERQKDFPTLID